MEWAEWRSGVKGAERMLVFPKDSVGLFPKAVTTKDSVGLFPKAVTCRFISQGCNLNCLKFNFYKLKGSKRNTENSNSTLDN